MELVGPFFVVGRFIIGKSAVAGRTAELAVEPELGELNFVVVG